MGIMLKNKKPINVYWSFFSDNEQEQDWSFLYPKPKTLFSNLVEKRDDIKSPDSYFSCPAVSNKTKKILVFNAPCDSSYRYKKINDEYIIEPISENWINASFVRKQALKDMPTINFSLGYVLFADEDLSVYFTSPYFSEPKYTTYGLPVPGEFNIGSWYRTYNLELQVWNSSGEIHIKEGEPLFYAEFKTDRPINFHRNNYNQTLDKYQKANILSKNIFGNFETLEKKYERFKQVGFKEKILTEIKKNLIDEVPYRF